MPHELKGVPIRHGGQHCVSAAAMRVRRFGITRVTSKASLASVSAGGCCRGPREYSALDQFISGPFTSKKKQSCLSRPEPRTEL